MAPTVGSFFVRPFEFLSVLDAVFNATEFEQIREQLPSRLNAAAGEVHPRVAKSSLVGLPQLKEWWQHSWSVLWGPPGTGKTYTTGQQIAKALHDQRERILVVSTTNRATDAVALSIGRAAQEFCPKELANLHSRQDDVIPFADSEELIANSGLPPESLIEVGDDHRLADEESLEALLSLILPCLLKQESSSVDNTTGSSSPMSASDTR